MLQGLTPRDMSDLITVSFVFIAVETGNRELGSFKSNMAAILLFYLLSNLALVKIVHLRVKFHS